MVRSLNWETWLVLNWAVHDISYRSLFNNQPRLHYGVFSAHLDCTVEVSNQFENDGELKRDFPEDIDYTIVYDPTNFIRDSIKAVILHYLKRQCLGSISGYFIFTDMAGFPYSLIRRSCIHCGYLCPIVVIWVFVNTLFLAILDWFWPSVSWWMMRSWWLKTLNAVFKTDYLLRKRLIKQ